MKNYTYKNTIFFKIQDIVIFIIAILFVGIMAYWSFFTNNYYTHLQCDLGNSQIVNVYIDGKPNIKMSDAEDKFICTKKYKLGEVF